MDSQGQSIRQVTRKELYTSFGKRMEYIKAFVGFTDDDAIIFNKGAKYLKAAIPTLAHRLYERMLEFDITARALRTRTTTSDSPVDDLFTIDSPQVQRRKIFWKWYLTRFCSDPSQLEYWEYLDKVGRMHTGKILMHPLTIEYVHMNACIGYLKQMLLETISLHPDMSIQFKFAFIRSVSKILCVQNDLIARCYIPEDQEFLKASHPESKAAPATPDPDTASTAETASSMPEQEASPDRPVSSLTQSSPSSAAGRTHVSGDSWSHVSSSRDTVMSSDVSSDNVSIASGQPVSEYTHTPPRFVSPFAVDHLQTFETKIWSNGGKRR
ncbi:hypothetical protein AFGD_004294 [Aspergillus terreus]|uniref:Uncharacterized protein n=1 Tax=Aspergillus terreus TaxID=33178 RepID=A0A5M3Z695_ASPTE|nr:hypothetical protein ATETN484_0009046300 [Aspergillus terreus]GFF17914.1 hypothetical protein AFGD_004294 [Aspergillus terreus]